MTDPMSALTAPAATSKTGLTVGLSAGQRLELAMRRTNDAAPEAGDQAQGVQWSYSSVGVPNPFGKGIRAFEPNTELIDAYANVKGDYDAHKQAEADAAAAAAAAASASAASAGSGLGIKSGAPNSATYAADGQVKTMIDAAMQLANRRVPYVWGGTSANGVDCSGLIYYAARAAGITLDGKAWPRLRAVDYGRLGVAVTAQDARPGDIVYFDEPGPSNGTDHVGIYIGNGKMIQAPTTGDVVKVSNVGRATSYRRVFEDSAFGQIATAAGGSTAAYGGRPYEPAVGTYVPGRTLPGLTQALGSTITRPPALKQGAGGRNRAI